MSQRKWNFYRNAEKGWLEAQGQYSAPGYYLRSFVYRFLAVQSLVRRFESEAIYIDQRIAERTDLTFLSYLTAIGWVMTDVSLFEGLQYDDNSQRDHFFGDNLRLYCDACIDEGNFIIPDVFVRRLKDDRTLDPVFAFFDSLNRSENRLRWDRLVASHLILMAFLNAFGYKTQFSDQSRFIEVARQIRHVQVLNNLCRWLTRLGLCGRDTKLLVAACKVVGREYSLPRAQSNPETR